MKTGKHEDKPQVLGQLLTIGNFLRRDYKKSSFLRTLFLKNQLKLLTNAVLHMSKSMCLPKNYCKINQVLNTQTVTVFRV